jgi:hypothetical protein
MPKKTERRVRLAARNERIRAKYQAEWMKGYRNAKIIADLVVSENLDTLTLEAIVFRKGVYKDF